MLPPSVVIKRSRSGGGRARALRWCRAGERAMNAMDVVILSELSQLTRQVHRISEKHPIQVLTPDRADQPLNEGVGDRSVRNRLDFLDLEHA